MSKLSVENLKKYIDETASKRKIEISCGYGEFEINIESLSNIEKISSLVKGVVEETFVDVTEPNYFYKDIAFVSYFLKLFTDFPVPVTENDDGVKINVSEVFDMSVKLNIFNNILCIPEVSQLYSYINKQIEFENSKLIAYTNSSSASDEAIETFNLVMNKGLDVLNKVADTLETVDDLFESGKVLEMMPKDKLDLMGDWLQNLTEKVNVPSYN